MPRGAASKVVLLVRGSGQRWHSGLRWSRRGGSCGSVWPRATGYPSSGPLSLMAEGTCPKEFPVKRGGACYEQGRRQRERCGPRAVGGLFVRGARWL